MKDKQIQIPEGWEEKYGYEIFQVQGGYAFKSDDYKDEGVLLVRIGNVGNGKFQYKDVVYVPKRYLKSHKNFLLNKGDVLMGLTGDLGKICILNNGDFPFILNQRVAKFNCVNILNEYLNYLLSSQKIQNNFDALFAGGAQKNISPANIEGLKYLLPKSTTEQKKIAEILSKVDTTIEQTQSLIAKYQRIKTGLMQDLLTKGIDENGNIRSEETHDFKDSELGRIPEEWRVVTADSLFDMILGKMLNKEAKTGSEQFEYLGNKDVKWGDFNFVELETMNFNSSERIKLKLKYNDLLVCEGGDVGRCAIWREERKNVFFQKAIHRLRPKTDEIIIDFMFEYMSLFVQKSIFNDYVSQTSIKHFTQEKFKQIPVLLPLKKEQVRIVNFSLKQNKLIIFEKEKYSKLQSIKTGLMQDLLSGKKRVTDLIMNC